MAVVGLRRRPRLEVMVGSINSKFMRGEEDKTGFRKNILIEFSCIYVTGSFETGVRCEEVIDLPL